MCGVPHHALDTYVARLVAAGKKVAIAEQTEAPQKGKTLVARKIVRIVTPGTLVDPDRLDARQANELAAVAWDGWSPLSPSSTSRRASSPSSASPGTRRPPRCSHAARPDGARPFPGGAGDGLGMAPGALAPSRRSSAGSPSESPRGRGAAELLEGHFRTSTLAGSACPPPGPPSTRRRRSSHYVRGRSAPTARTSPPSGPSRPREGLVVDAVTAGHLELFRSLRDGGRAGTLLDVVDRTGTAFGARALRRLLERPLARTRARSRRGSTPSRSSMESPRGSRGSREAPGDPGPPAPPLAPRGRLRDAPRGWRASRRGS